MEVLVYCICSIACFVAGAVVSGGFRIAVKNFLPADEKTAEDELTMDISSMLRYDARKQEDFDSD